MTSRIRCSSALGAFFLLFSLSYIAKPLLWFFVEDDYLFWTFNNLNYSPYTFFSLIVATAFACFFLVGYKYSFNKYSLINTVSSGPAPKLLSYTFALVSLWTTTLDYSNSLIVVIDSVSLMFCLVLCLENSWVSKFTGLAILGFRAAAILSTKTPFVFFFIGAALLIPNGKDKFINVFNVNTFRYFLLYPFFIFFIGSLQVLRWVGFDFNEFSFSDIVSGYATTFDQLDTLNYYLWNYNSKFIADFGYWIGDLYMLIPRFLWENKPTNYGSRLITEYLYPDAFYINDDGTGGGQFPNGILVQSLDFASAFGLIFYAAACGALVKAIDKGLQDGRWHVFATSFFMLLSINSLVRTGLIEFVLYSSAYVFCFLLISITYMHSSTRMLTGLKKFF